MTLTPDPAAPPLFETLPTPPIVDPLLAGVPIAMPLPGTGASSAPPPGDPIGVTISPPASDGDTGDGSSSPPPGNNVPDVAGPALSVNPIPPTQSGAPPPAVTILPEPLETTIPPDLHLADDVFMNLTGFSGVVHVGQGDSLLLGGGFVTIDGPAGQPPTSTLTATPEIYEIAGSTIGGEIVINGFRPGVDQLLFRSPVPQTELQETDTPGGVSLHWGNVMVVLPGVASLDPSMSHTLT